MILGLSSIAFADQPQDAAFAVIELFSSEGCSSCPAADLLVSRISAWARQNHQPIYPLIFHVDYWNGLGWRDVFSSHAFTERQKQYARIFKDQGVYTPEMIVNGSDAFGGSNQQQLQKDLNQDLSIPPNGVLHISFVPQGDHIIVKYSAEGFSEGDVINFALVERGLATDVTAGENAGRRLHHDNVVREFQTFPVSKSQAQVNISVNKIQDLSQASLIAYVQNPQTMLIEAAQQLDLEND